MTTKIERILNLLIKEDKSLTANDIALKETLEIKKVRVYLNTLCNDKRIERSNDKRPYRYIAITPKANLKRLKEKSDLDTQILMKMIPLFIENNLKLENTNEIEDNRIMELIPQCQ